MRTAVLCAAALLCGCCGAPTTPDVPDLSDTDSTGPDLGAADLLPSAPFSASLFPRDLTIPAGESRRVAATIWWPLLTEATPDLVSLTASGLPAGVTVDVAPNSAPDPISTRWLTITVASSAQATAHVTATVHVTVPGQTLDLPLDVSVGPEPSGALDQSFGTYGHADLAAGGVVELGINLAVQADGKVVVLGHSQNPWDASFLARLDTDGKLDPSFGKKGIRMLKPSTDSSLLLYDLAIAPDGKIVAVGTGSSADGSTGYDGLVVRVDAAGDLDTSFGGSGLVYASMLSLSQPALNRVVVQPDGKIVAAGEDAAGPALLRFNTDGTRDGGFGQSGRVALTEIPAALLLSSTGELVTAVAASIHGFTSAGQADPALQGSDSILTITDAVLLSSGKILAAGLHGLTDAPWVDRHLADGTPDASYQSTLLPGRGMSLVVLSDGRVVVAGDQEDHKVSSALTLTRLDIAGQVELGFASAADGLFPIAVGQDQPKNVAATIRVAVAPDGHLYVITSLQHYNPKATLLRFLP